MADRVSDFLAMWAHERPDLDASPMGVLGRISRANAIIGRELSEYFADSGLQPGEFDVLATLRRVGAPYTLSPGALAATTMVSGAAVTNRLNRLEDKGLIRRSIDPDNRRAIRVVLTDRGRALVDDLVEGHLANERRLLAGLDPAEQEQLGALLARLLESRGDVSQA